MILKSTIESFIESTINKINIDDNKKEHLRMLFIASFKRGKLSRYLISNEVPEKLLKQALNAYYVILFKSMRLILGLTQLGLAEKIELTQKQIGNIENQKRNVQFQTILALKYLILKNNKNKVFYSLFPTFP